jgi:nitroimidazol reductase NimA-like FMN-containing flavoprotein (pyridoxamine 5'-phosphate oxidase superfamily)
LGQTDASRIADEKYIYLTTGGRKTGNPHAVELWFAIARKKIYLSHEGRYADWMKKHLRISARIAYDVEHIGPRSILIYDLAIVTTV